jgi:hypothetical protein
MHKVIAKWGLAFGSAVLLTGLIAGPAAAAPKSAAPKSAAEDQASVSVDPTLKVPAPTRAAPAPTQPKNEPVGQGVSIALAAHLDGTCNMYASGTGDLCQWYFSGYSGSRVDYYYADNSFWNDTFLSAGSGQGATVANNAESAYNYDSIWTAWVCTSTNRTGTCGYIRPRSGGNYNPSWFNNSESLYWTV